jgi:hypothetical protein
MSCQIIPMIRLVRELGGNRLLHFDRPLVSLSRLVGSAGVRKQPTQVVVRA